MNHRKLLICRFAAYLLIVIFLSVFADELIAQNRNTIGGHVFDSQRRPVGQIYVELQNEVYSALARTKTDGSGRYFFSSLSAGRFYIRVLPYGTNLEEQTQEVEIVTVVAGRSVSENAQKDFYLRERRDRADSPTITGTVFVQDVPQKAQEAYKKAIAEFDAKSDEAGVKELQNALQVFPDYFLALERLGSEFIKFQMYLEAQVIYQKAVAVNPRSFGCWYGLSFASYGLNQAKEAVEAAEKAVSLNPQSIEATLLLGISERRAKQYEKAEKSLKRADKLAKGKSADAHWNLALLYAHNLKRYNEAADELELYLKIQPNAENAEAVKKLIKQFRGKNALDYRRTSWMKPDKSRLSSYQRT